MVQEIGSHVLARHGQELLDFLASVAKDGTEDDRIRRLMLRVLDIGQDLEALEAQNKERIEAEAMALTEQTLQGMEQRKEEAMPSGGGDKGVWDTDDDDADDDDIGREDSRRERDVEQTAQAGQVLVQKKEEEKKKKNAKRKNSRVFEFQIRNKTYRYTGGTAGKKAKSKYRSVVEQSESLLLSCLPSDSLLLSCLQGESLPRESLLSESLLPSFVSFV